MANAPKVLTEYISTESIVPAENMPVKALPAALPCPNPECSSKHSFALYRDPTSELDTTVWGFCTKCGTTGDVIELYMQKTGKLTPIEAIHEIRANGWAVIDDATEAGKLSMEYDILRQLRVNVQNFWEKARQQMTGPTHPVLSAMPLEPNQSFKFLGSTTKAELRAAFGINLKSSDKLLVVPFQDVPGRISMLRIYYKSGSTIKQRDIQMKYTNEPGIFMLNSAPIHSDLVLAVNDPLMAFQMQNHFMLAHTAPWPILAYTSSSARWDSVVADKVLFWTQQFSIDFFRTVSRVPGALVAVADGVIDHVKYMRSVSVKEWTNQVLSQAVPWMHSLGAWLCSINADEASATLRNLELTSAQREELVDTMASTESRRGLRELLDANARAREIRHDRGYVVERNGSWYAMEASRRKELLVSDTVIKLNGTVCLSGAGNYYTGLICRKGISKRFYAPMDMPDRENKSWLEDFCLENGMGCPEVARGWDRKLFAIARSFSGELTNEVRDGKVGWSQDLSSFSLPHRVVREGRIDAEVGVPVDRYPCQKVTGKRITAKAIKTLLEHNQPNAQFWALFACSMMNAASPFFGTRKKKIAAVGQSNFAQAFANAMDFSTVHISKNTAGSHEIHHDVPTHCTFDHVRFGEIVRWLNDPEEKNILTGLNYLQACQIPDEDWVFIHTGGFSKMSNIHAAYDLIPHAMKFVQVCDHRVSAFTPDIFLRRFREVLQKRFLGDTVVDFSVMDEALRLISPQAPFGATYGQAFLYGVFCMMQEGKVKQSRKPSVRGYIVEVGNKTVVLNRKVVSSVVLDGCTQRVGSSLMEEPAKFESDYSAWRISRRYWDETFARFQKEQIF